MLFYQSLPRDLPPTIISQGEKFKPVHGQLEWSSDESPEDKFYKEHRLKRRPNLKAVASPFFFFFNVNQAAQLLTKKAQKSESCWLKSVSTLMLCLSEQSQVSSLFPQRPSSQFWAHQAGR